MYQHAGAALLRAGTIRADTDLPAWPSLGGGADEQARQWRGWLERVWSQDRFAEAIEFASPVLARQVRKALDGPGAEPRQTRRLGMSVARYILRMTDRATPFGLFAGVAPAMLGSGLTARCGDGHRAVAQPAAEWLAAVVTRLEAYPESLTRLPVIASNVCFIRNGRLVAPAQQHVRGGDGTMMGRLPPWNCRYVTRT